LSEVRWFVRTTGMCPVCKTAVELNLSDREFTCPSCVSTFDGHVASAVVMLKEGFARGTQATPGDEQASAVGMEEYFSRIPHVRVSASMNREAPPVIVG